MGGRLDAFSGLSVKRPCVLLAAGLLAVYLLSIWLQLEGGLLTTIADVACFPEVKPLKASAVPGDVESLAAGDTSWPAVWAFHMYEAFKSAEQHADLHAGPPFIGVAMTPGITRPVVEDLDGPSLLPALIEYSSQLCNYGPILVVGTQLAALQADPATPWLGFQNPALKALGKVISDYALQTLHSHLAPVQNGGRTAAGANGFYYWVTWREVGVTSQMYEQCDLSHGQCSSVFSLVFEQLFGSDEAVMDAPPPDLAVRPTALPPLPESAAGWCFESAFLLHISSFPSLLRLTRMFIVALESIWDTHNHPERCPMLGIGDKPCFAVLLDRLVNVWAYHSGRRMMLVLALGASLEVLPLTERTMWSHWFADDKIEQAYERFPGRLHSTPSLTLFNHLSGSTG
eukprot:TRINITY_DN704_c0_g1_i1.p1 TRINITY_DN704_c0_g1~~TRINITY_DN704_c0_g1_i1.p1  ORF type:complete len:400 (-),score=45.37 TRINITY_DN704_c0_g1_i1:413-1612(-)